MNEITTGTPHFNLFPNDGAESNSKNDSSVWELCPKCDGEGRTYADMTIMTEQCNVCNGKMIISKLTGLPPA
jgi:DnaJ-class molecular chaperone